MADRVLADTYLDVPIYLQDGKFVGVIEPPPYDPTRPDAITDRRAKQIITRATLAACKREIEARKGSTTGPSGGPLDVLIIQTIYGRIGGYVRACKVVSYQRRKDSYRERGKWRAENGDLIEVDSNHGAITPLDPDVQARVAGFNERERLLREEWQAFLVSLPKVIANAQGRPIIEVKEANAHGN